MCLHVCKYVYWLYELLLPFRSKNKNKRQSVQQGGGGSGVYEATTAPIDDENRVMLDKDTEKAEYKVSSCSNIYVLYSLVNVCLRKSVETITNTCLCIAGCSIIHISKGRLCTLTHRSFRKISLYFFVPDNLV